MTLLENVPLAPYTTLGVGGPARWFAEANDEAGILAALRFARERHVPHFILGGGSNLLVSDEGFPGVVLRITAAQVSYDEASASLTADSGLEWDSVVRLAVDNNAAGIECLAGIPGSVGGTPVQNVGAYGQEVARTIVRVHAIDLEAERAVEFAAGDCGFAYRRSLFNTTHKGRYAITRVVYALRPGAPPHLEYRDVKLYFAERGLAHPSLAETAAAIRAIRSRKGMLLSADDPDSQSAGSFFKNPIVSTSVLSDLSTRAGCRADEIPQYPAGLESGPGYEPGAGAVKLSAAWLIERVGFHKGFTLGHAGLSTKHVLALVNRGNATAAEIVTLRDTITAEVHARFGVALEQEPVTLGFLP